MGSRMMGTGPRIRGGRIRVESRFNSLSRTLGVLGLWAGCCGLGPGVPVFPESGFSSARVVQEVSSQEPGRGPEQWVARLDPGRTEQQRYAALLALRVDPGRGSPGLIGVLAQIAEAGPKSPSGLLAMEILGAFDTRAGCQALLGLARGFEPAQGALVLSYLPATPRSLGPLLGLMAQEQGGLEAPSNPVLAAAALARLAPLLADPAAPKTSPMELVFAGRGLDPTLRAAGIAGLRTLIARLGALGDPELMAQRGEALLAADSHNRWLLIDLARVTLLGGGDWALAKRWSDALLHQVPGILLDQRGSFEAQMMVSRIQLLAAIVAVAGGQHSESKQYLARGHQHLVATIAARGDRTHSRVNQIMYAEAMQVRGLLLLADLYGDLLVDPTSPSGQELGTALHRARDLHQACLEIDAANARHSISTTSNWDAVLRGDMSMVMLLLGTRGISEDSADRGLAARRTLGRLLATVSGLEMPGFVPYDWDDEMVTNPLQDPLRSHWLDERRWSMKRLSERFLNAERRTVEARRVPFLLDEDSFRARQDQRGQVRFVNNLVAGPLNWEVVSSLRWPSDMALRLAEDLRREGRPSEALALATRYGRDLAEAGDFPSWFLLSQIQQARADSQSGTAYTDMDEPLRAEEALLRGVDRTESLIATLKARGIGGGLMAQARGQLARLLSSLAVNANVKLGQPEKAVAWVERAHELRGTASSTVLLACYRARAGRLEEALDLLSQVSPEPGMEYNLACTQALLGNRDAALQWLERSLAQAGTTPGELRREKDWAARDPDLVSLREDSRFLDLVD